MGSAQSTRRRAPTHRLADAMGQSQTVDSDVSREGYENVEEDAIGESNEENTHVNGTCEIGDGTESIEVITKFWVGEFRMSFG